MLRILLVILTLLIGCLPAFAMPHGATFQIKNYSVLIPYLAIGIPIGNQNGIELGGISLGGTSLLAAVFSWHINSSGNSENERSLVNIGALFWHLETVQSGGGWFSGGFFPNDITLPLIEFEQERLISDKFSWLLNVGYPSLVGFGLKWYF